MERSPDFKSKSLKAVEVLILDEADRLLDMGFQAALNTILSAMPKQVPEREFLLTITSSTTTPLI